MMRVMNNIDLGPDRADKHDAVSRIAFDIYTQHGSKLGNDVEDWLEAERRVDAHRSYEGHAVNHHRHGWLTMVPVMTAYDTQMDVDP